MKKILITGMNTNQTTFDFYLRMQLKVVPSQYSLFRALTDMGYEVHQRAVNIGETLEEYDDVIVYIHNPAGFAGFVYNALWAISARPDCILAFDDWQTDSIYSGLTALEDPEKLFRAYVKDGHTSIPEDIQSYETALISAIQKIKSKTNRMLISAYAGGDCTKVLEYPKDKMFTFNPNPYHLNRQTFVHPMLEKTPKERVFNFAGLVQGKTKKWLKSQDIPGTGWDLKLYGSRKDGQDRVTEDKMVNIYGEHWGILMAGYFHAGSGWWRARPLQVADAGSILIGEPEEMTIYYHDEFLSSIKPVDIIQMSDTELAAIAEAQKEALYKHHPLDKLVEQAELNAVLNATK